MNTNIFKASNGFKVMVDPDGDLEVWDDEGNHETWIAENQIPVLAEYFQHRRDEELGRWREPENPDYVVYPDEMSPDWVLVLQESTGDTDTVFNQRRKPAEDGEFTLVADRYFAAHPKPEPRPWEDAKPGEYWALTRDGIERVYWVAESYLGLAFHRMTRTQHVRTTYLKNDTITAGRRIWPEAGDGSLAVLDRIREAVKGHPECDVHPDGDPISCGWKRAYSDVVAALKEGDNQ